MLQSVAIGRFGLNTVNRKKPFESEQVVRFAEAYGVRLQGYCHLVVKTMVVVESRRDVRARRRVPLVVAEHALP